MNEELEVFKDIVKRFVLETRHIRFTEEDFRQWYYPNQLYTFTGIVKWEKVLELLNELVRQGYLKKTKWYNKEIYMYESPIIATGKIKRKLRTDEMLSVILDKLIELEKQINELKKVVRIGGENSRRKKD